IRGGNAEYRYDTASSTHVAGFEYLLAVSPETCPIRPAFEFMPDGGEVALMRFIRLQRERPERTPEIAKGARGQRQQIEILGSMGAGLQYRQRRHTQSFQHLPA